MFILDFFRTATAGLAPWDCPGCGRTGNTGNYCGRCAHPAPWIEGTSEKLSRGDFEKVGNIVKFGHYEQDNNLENGLEEIEWIVLDVQKGKSLLISKYGLDTKPYNTTDTDVTWDTCTLRNWLNSDFLKAAFMGKEQSEILTTSVDNSKNQGYSDYSTDSGNNTQDQIFLLSYREAFDLYFKNDDERKCVPTQYAKAQGAYIRSLYMTDGNATGWWWLRSPAFSHFYATFVTCSGTCYYSNINYDSGCVRPALWINLQSDLF